MMVDTVGSNAASLLGKIPHFDPKLKEDAKRAGGMLDEEFESSSKRVKLRDLHLVLQSEGVNPHENIVDTQSSQVVDENPVEKRAPCKSPTHLDLNTELCTTDENSTYNEQTRRSKATHFDLNAEDVASSAIQDSFYSCTSHNSMKSKTILDFGRGHSEDKEALKRWKEMKQNGFVSPSYGGGGIPPVAPKQQRGRKSKNDVMRKKMELAKKEQVDRFTKIAAPSGLLNGLNPGIINHVRNSKQVHSIIQALVRSEKRESRKQATETTNTEQHDMNSSGILGSSLSYDDQAGGFCNSMQEMNLMGDMKLSHTGCSSHTETCFGSDVKQNGEDDDILTLKLSSSTTMVSESNSCVSNVESENVNSVDDLSVQAASVASQWLQLLQQDINGRLAALRRSKKRVQAVIITELPALLSKEFSTFNQENAPQTASNATGILHQARWNKLFDQLNTSLSEEEKELDHWLQQVTQMQQHCDQSLQHVQLNTMFGMHYRGAKDNQLRSQLNDPEKDLSLRAAAASIYSTCNFVSSMENVSCC